MHQSTSLSTVHESFLSWTLQTEASRSNTKCRRVLFSNSQRDSKKKREQRMDNIILHRSPRRIHQSCHHDEEVSLLNTTLIQLASLDPSNQHCEDASSSLVRLAESLPQVIPVEKLGAVQQESKLLTIKTKVSLSEDTDPADCHFRLDTDWWCKIFKIRESGQIKYALLSSLVKALLSIFSGPLVENTFNIMDDIMERDQSRMTSQNYEAFAMIKSHMMAHKITACDMQPTKSLRKNIASAYERYQSKEKTLSLVTLASSAQPTKARCLAKITFYQK